MPKKRQMQSFVLSHKLGRRKIGRIERLKSAVRKRNTKSNVRRKSRKPSNKKQSSIVNWLLNKTSKTNHSPQGLRPVTPLTNLSSRQPPMLNKTA